MSIPDQSSDETGLAMFTTDTLGVGLHRLQLTATDEAALSTADSLFFAVQ